MALCVVTCAVRGTVSTVARTCAALFRPRPPRYLAPIMPTLPVFVPDVPVTLPLLLAATALPRSAALHTCTACGWVPVHSPALLQGTAAAAAAPTPDADAPPPTIPVAPPANSTLDTDAEVDALVAAKKVVVFTESTCPVCVDLMERLDDAGVAPFEVQLDKLGTDVATGHITAAGAHVLEHLHARTGQHRVPFVFIGGEFVPAEVAIAGIKAPAVAPPAPPAPPASGSAPPDTAAAAPTPSSGASPVPVTADLKSTFKDANVPINGHFRP